MDTRRDRAWKTTFVIGIALVVAAAATEALDRTLAIALGLIGFALLYLVFERS